MTYENLIRLQTFAQLIFVICLFGGLVFLLIGIVRAHWVGLSSRWRVLLATLGIWLFGVIGWGAAVGYTHSQPNGPHGFESYMDTITATQCMKSTAAKGCDKLKQKCAEQDQTHPSCRILAGENPSKFMTTTTR